MPNYNTDSELLMRFDITFYAATQTDADNTARTLINTLFGSSMAGMMEVITTSNVALSGQDISGANYYYEYVLDYRMGKSDVTADTAVYNTIFAATAADALASLYSTATRLSNRTSFPIKIIYLKAA